MAKTLHGSARTTPRLRAELQSSQASTAALARQYGLNPKTVAKWRQRTHTADRPMGPRQPRTAALSPVQEAMVVEFRRRTLLPLDDVFGCLRLELPGLSRSALHRCLQRHGLSRLPLVKEPAPKRGRFAPTTLGYVPLDFCDLATAEGKVRLFVAIDRVSKWCVVALAAHATGLTGAGFLRQVLAALPYPIHTVLTDNGAAFCWCVAKPAVAARHPFVRVCAAHGIKHRRTRPYHPWTNGQAERMNRTLKDATVKAFHYESLQSLESHLRSFLGVYHFAKHLRALRGRTPYEYLGEQYDQNPSAFHSNPRHLIPGPYS